MRLALSVIGVGFTFLFSSKSLASNPQDPNLLAEQMWQKAVAGNLDQAARSHATFQKLLADANQDVIGILQTNIKDLNDPKKFPKLDLKQRAWLVARLEEKVREVNEDGALEALIRESNNDSTTGSNGATLYEAWDYEGKSVRKGPGLHRVKETQLANDSISSIKVAKGFMVVVFDGEFGGQSTIFTNNVARLTDVAIPGGQGNWNDAISSFIVLKLPASSELD